MLSFRKPLNARLLGVDWVPCKMVRARYYAQCIYCEDTPILPGDTIVCDHDARAWAHHDCFQRVNRVVYPDKRITTEAATSDTA